MDTADALSEVLRLVRLRACVYFVKDMAPPWGLDIPAVSNGPLHMVLDGKCLFRHADVELELSAGDAVVLPHGARHVFVDANETVPEPGPQVMDRLMKSGETVATPGSTRMLCGHFEWDGTLDHPLFGELPEVIVVRDMFARDGAELFKTVISLITQEQTGEAPGAAAIADRMGEVMFVSLLRAWVAEQEPKTGILATMLDVRLSRAVDHIHHNHGGSVEINDLARVAGMSRTAFAVRFHEVMGMPPASYVTEWRMLQARRLLGRTEVAMPEIVDRVGYGSDASFIRAFKRRFGETPARFRRNTNSATL